MRHMKSFFKDLTMYERKLCYPSFAIHSKQVYMYILSVFFFKKGKEDVIAKKPRLWEVMGRP